jgi:hypothetical protein
MVLIIALMMLYAELLIANASSNQTNMASIAHTHTSSVEAGDGAMHRMKVVWGMASSRVNDVG